MNLIFFKFAPLYGYWKWRDFDKLKIAKVERPKRKKALPLITLAEPFVLSIDFIQIVFAYIAPSVVRTANGLQSFRQSCLVLV